MRRPDCRIFLQISLVLTLCGPTDFIFTTRQALIAQEIPKSEPGPPANRLPNARGNAAGKPRGGLRISGAPAGAIRKEVEKKNSSDRPNLKRQRDTQYYRVAITRPDQSFLGLNYYPALPGDNPPVILLIHEKDRSSRDFTDKVEEFKTPTGLAAALQADGFAVVTLDVAGLTDPRKRNASLMKDETVKPSLTGNQATSSRMVEQAVTDLRLTYQFLVDRHNRLEFNLGKLSILTLGEGTNVVLEWMREATAPSPLAAGIRPNAADPRLKNAGAQIATGARNTATDRPSDVSALIMISPVESWQSVRTLPLLKTLLDGSPVPTLVIGGQNDKESAETLKQIKPVVERRQSRLSKVEELATSLHGARLLRFEPEIVSKINRFLEQTVEFQTTQWEPRYNLTPVTYKLIEAVSKTMAEAASRDSTRAAAEKKQEQPKVRNEDPKPDEKAAIVPKGAKADDTEPKQDNPKPE
ncbi:MAG: hypothetical protein RJA81_2139 [Planctomycetota bacterium]